MSDERGSEAALAVLQRCRTGDVQPALDYLARCAGASESAERAWCLALRAECSLAGVDVVAPSADELTALREAADERCRAPLVYAWFVMARRAALRFELASQGACLEQADTLLAEDAGESRVTLELLQCWQRLLGHRGGDVAQLDELRKRGARAGSAANVVDAVALRALAHAERGELAEAMEAARTAARMARTEELPQQEYLAAVVLARVRRLSGRPHLAAHILSSLQRYASPAWGAWIDWELALANGLSATAARDRSGPAAILCDWLQAVRAEQTGLVHELEVALEQRLAGHQLALRDFARARMAVLPEAEVAAEPQLSAWRRGEPVELPYGLAGLAQVEVDSPVQTLACVLAGRDGQPPLRVVNVGRSFAQGEFVGTALRAAKHARTQKLLAVLALAAQDGLPEAEAFLLAYDFRFNPEAHRDIFNVALHRVRSQIAGSGALVREGGRLRLTLNGPSVLPDPRCALPVGERVLKRLAHAAENAKGLSDALGISLRATQGALEALHAEGLCVRRKEGRHVEYAIEDTTYQEPTRHRQRAL